MVVGLLSLVLLAGEVPAQRQGDLVWKTAETVEKGGDRTFVAAGTRKGHRYVFRATAMCWWEPTVLSLWTGHGWELRRRDRLERIFGSDFRVLFGSNERLVLNLGEKKPEQTERAFIADRDDVPIRVLDNWVLPEKVRCAVDGIEVIAADADR